MNVKKSLALFLAFVMVLLFAACSANTETVQDNIMTISFEYGERTGTYTGDKDENGLPHGYGTFTSQKTDGTSWTYTGAWDHGHWNGQGHTVWSTGESHSGYYSDDGTNGYGVYTTSDGIIISGNFIDGTPTGYCAVYLNGDYEGYVFWGNYINGDAEGMIYTPSGNTIAATYKNGEIQFIPDHTTSSTINDLQGESPTDPVETASVETESIAEETTPKTEVTSGMRNALRAAENYLSIMPFSYIGLIEQLEYEEYTREEAIYAADNCGADWYEQAAKDAKNYLDMMPFSRGGLIDQLEYEGYTSEQAAYAADQNGL